MSEDASIHNVCLKHSAHERAIQAHDKRLSKHGESMDELKDCVVRLAALQEHTAHWQEQAEERLRELEAVPVKRWNTSVSTVITSVVSALVGAAIAAAGLQTFIG